MLAQSRPSTVYGARGACPSGNSQGTSRAQRRVVIRLGRSASGGRNYA